MKAKVNSTAHGDSVPASESAADDSGLITKQLLARAIRVSTRTVDSWQKQKRIPFLKLSARCVRFHLPSVLRALKRFEVKEVTR